MIITIDGPAGTGKTTVAKKVAEKLGVNYFDTGAMYRAVTFCVLQNKINLEDESALKQLLEGFLFDIKDKRYYVGSEDVTEAIRTREVTQYVSEVAAKSIVRQHLVNIQRKFGEKKDAVFEGRDIGTVVFPNAEHKFFLTAAPEVRAERRYKELDGKQSHKEVLQNILKRDHLDSTREVSPLKQAEDAHLVDTSTLSIDEVIEAILRLIK